MADVEMSDAPASAKRAEAKGTDGKKKFEVKKWNAVALWAWDIVVDNCAICRNHIMDLCIECQANQASATSEECTVAWGICNVGLPAMSDMEAGGISLTIHYNYSMHSTSIVFRDGSRPDPFVPLTTEIGNSKNTVDKVFFLEEVMDMGGEDSERIYHGETAEFALEPGALDD